MYWRVLKTALLLGLEFLEAAFLSGLYEHPVAALVAGLPGVSGLAPSKVAAAQALVADFKRVHGGFTVAALRQFRGIPCLPVGAVAVPALV